MGTRTSASGFCSGAGTKSAWRPPTTPGSATPSGSSSRPSRRAPPRPPLAATRTTTWLASTSASSLGLSDSARAGPTRPSRLGFRSGPGPSTRPSTLPRSPPGASTASSPTFPPLSTRTGTLLSLPWHTTVTTVTTVMATVTTVTTVMATVTTVTTRERSTTRRRVRRGSTPARTARPRLLQRQECWPALASATEVCSVSSADSHTLSSPNCASLASALYVEYGQHHPDPEHGAHHEHGTHPEHGAHPEH